MTLNNREEGRNAVQDDSDLLRGNLDQHAAHCVPLPFPSCVVASREKYRTSRHPLTSPSDEGLELPRPARRLS